jgi:hypothetical protein
MDMDHRYRGLVLMLSLLAGGCALTVGPGPAEPGADAGVDTVLPPADTGGCLLPGGGTCPWDASCPAGDGCNVCTCGPDGQARCTLRDCAPADAGAPGCRSSLECGDYTLMDCVFPQGCGTTQGTCESPVVCDAPAPWCGCDGETFLACRPDRPYAYSGPCLRRDPPDPAACVRSDQCANGQRCALLPGCPASAGHCVSITACEADPTVQTACGCDGATFIEHGSCAPDRPYQHLGSCR